MTARFLFLSARPESDAAAAEFSSIRRATGLGPDRLEHLRLDVEPLLDPDPRRFAGVIVGGSPFNVTTAEDRKSQMQRRVEADLARLAEQALAADHPVLFTCYGIGVLTRVLGGEVGITFGEPAAPVELELTHGGLRDPLLEGFPERFLAFAGHKEATDRVPADAVVLAASATCPVQVYRAGARVYATQFHPEVSADDFVARGRVYRDHGYFPADEFDAFTARARAVPVTEPQRMLRRFVELAEA